ncbi:MAG: phospho-N-acetylmuramoyl-pentapeptide-transferase [Candidatus Methylacidiphilales bacterium]
MLAELQGSKRGTPTMGGLLILFAVTVSSILWIMPDNRFIWLVLFSLLWMGAVGFADDYQKVKYKNSKGIPAKAKLIAQLVLAVFVYFYLNHYLVKPGGSTSPSQLPAAAAADLVTNNPAARLPSTPAPAVPDSTNLDGVTALSVTAVTTAQPMPTLNAPSNWRALCVPFLKEPLLLDMGIVFTLVFFILVIIGTSNGVNFTDGLDGLATGCSITVCGCYAIFCYVAGTPRFAAYLFIPYVEGANELAIFCAAMVGAGLGFLWFNCHPAKVFMGDTGSLALGAAIATVAICIHQELLLVVAGGVFVMEGGSVLLQVLSFKLTGKRIFAMAPIHHHFELKGWNESTVTIRFWILSLLFAMIALATLKIR